MSMAAFFAGARGRVIDRSARIRKESVDFLGDERKVRMQESERFLEHGKQHRHGAVHFSLVAGAERKLRGFYVPVAEIVPEELVERLSAVVVAVGIERVAAGFRRRVEPVVNPAVKLGKFISRHGDDLATFEVSENIAGSVPDLVREARTHLERFLVDENILSRGAHEGERELEGVGAVLPDDLERVEAVAEGTSTSCGPACRGRDHGYKYP